MLKVKRTAQTPACRSVKLESVTVMEPRLWRGTCLFEVFEDIVHVQYVGTSTLSTVCYACNCIIFCWKMAKPTSHNTIVKRNRVMQGRKLACSSSFARGK